MPFSKRKKSEKSHDMSGSALQAMRAVMRFSFSSLRGRIGQAIPVTLALLLIVGVAQAIGALHDVSSTLTRQQIAASWRGSADLLVRPQAAVSQPERKAGWINPQSAFDNYGGISAKQVASIASLSQVTQILLYATVGWRRIDVVTPVVLKQKGIYRITAQWTGEQQWAGNVVDYIEVSDLTNLTSEEPVLNPPVQHLVLPPNAPSVVYSMSIPALQLLVGVAPAQESMLGSYFSEGSNVTPPARLTIHIDRLNGQSTMLSSCTAQSAKSTCWQPVTAQTGHVTYLAQDVQLLRYSQARYSATMQQLSQGQLTLDALGEDTQGNIYRDLLQQHLTLPDSVMGIGQQVEVLPLTGPQHMSMLPDTPQFLPLAQACAVNGEQCYSGLYIRLRGVEHYNSKSLALLQSTSAAITARTGLHVDILDGSSTRHVTLTSGNANNTLTATWRVAGVAVQITHGVDALQNTLFVLCALICLLATGAAGILIGIGRRNEARALDQLGWSRSLQMGVYVFNALLLALPGCVLASALIMLASKFWPGNVPFSTMWILLASGTMIYGVSLVSMAVGPVQSSVGAGVVDDVGRGPLRSPAPLFTLFKLWGTHPHSNERAALKAPSTPPHPPPPLRTTRILHKSKGGGAFHTRFIAPLVCGIAITATIFLIAVEYLMVSGLNRELVVTVLGNQVRVALEGAQVLLVVLVLITALLTVGLCTSLLLRGRRDELALLAKVGWEQRHVLLRLLREGWRTGALSGVIGALLALGVIAVAGSLPPLWAMGSVLVGGPLVGVLLASLVVYTLARRELSSVYLERA
ncbi:MAG: hypothetical protein ACRDIV_08895 [Ktedonobacteraceae bacterium]